MLEFVELCDETRSWIVEKDQALSTEDCCRDLSSVQALQRTHQVHTEDEYPSTNYRALSSVIVGGISQLCCV